MYCRREKVLLHFIKCKQDFSINAQIRYFGANTDPLIFIEISKTNITDIKVETWHLDFFDIQYLLICDNLYLHLEELIQFGILIPCLLLESLLFIEKYSNLRHLVEVFFLI
jgi:hypothetical protein